MIKESKNNNIDLSLILATYGRIEEVIDFCNSLDSQTYDLKKIELIIVDQNEHYIIKDYILKNKHSYDIKYFRTSEKGLSNARNIGIKNSNGLIIGYPDDDCIYYQDTVEKVMSEFNNEYGRKVVVGKIFDRLTNKNIIRNWPKRNTRINFLNYYKFTSSITMFHSRDVDILFDKDMGAGKYFGSAEDLDFIYRFLELSYYIEYIQAIEVWHPEFNPKEISLSKVRSYSRGVGYFVRKKHIYFLPKLLYLTLLVIYKLYQFFSNIILNKFESKYFSSYFRGLFEGFLRNKK